MEKQHILNEIKRTTEENNGVVLGRSRFYQETGIKESDWKGKYWVRWSDAVKEVGLVPQQMASAYDEQLLIDKLIIFIRELGHFPIIPEYRLKTRQDKSFPSDSTFSSRLGNKRQIAGKIVEYCKQNEGYDDVLASCEIVLRETQTHKEDKESPDLTDVIIGYVYLMKSGKNYKIGRSNSIGRREYELTIQLPDKLEKVHTIRTDDPIGIEAYWHKRFEPKRKNSEWFELSSADVSAFKRRKFM